MFRGEALCSSKMHNHASAEKGAFDPKLLNQADQPEPP